MDSIGQRLRRRARAAGLSTKRFWFHLFRRYRGGSTPDSRRSVIEVTTAAPSALPREQHLTTSFTSPQSPTRITPPPSVRAEIPDEHLQTADEQAPAHFLSDAPRSRRTPRPLPPRRDDDVAVAAPAGWLSEWFGPVSPRRKLWLFVSTTGTVGIILALILLLNQYQSNQEPTPANIAAAPPEQSQDETPPAIVDKTPAPEIIAKPVVHDDFELQVILLPAPDEENQGEQFEVTSQPVVSDPSRGFDLATTGGWRESRSPFPAEDDPWTRIEALVPLEPLEPQEIAVTETPRAALHARFETTQPERAAPFRAASYELIVVNDGEAPLGRVTIRQTLPESFRPTEIAPASAVAGRSLRWDVSRLPPGDARRIPLQVVPTQSGAVIPETTLEAATQVSSRTLVQTADVAMSIESSSSAPVGDYQRLTFRITNTGDVRLNGLLMNVRLSENLWHRFGPAFEFHETFLEPGQTRIALLHVRGEQAGRAVLMAELTTDEGASAASQCSFQVRGVGAEEFTAPHTGEPEAKSLVPPRSPVETIREAPLSPDVEKAVTPETEFPAVPEPGRSSTVKMKEFRRTPVPEEELPKSKDPARNEPDPFDISPRQKSNDDLFEID